MIRGREEGAGQRKSISSRAMERDEEVRRFGQIFSGEASDAVERLKWRVRGRKRRTWTKPTVTRSISDKDASELRDKDGQEAEAEKRRGR